MRKQKKTLLEIIGGIIFVLSALYSINRLIFYFATRKEHLYTANGHFYKHSHGKVFYTKTGSGSPLLLIHDTNCCSSDYEWHQVVKQFAKTHTVYTIDLLGCGRSDKPCITYSSYLYVQLIHDFIQDIIGDTPDVIVTGNTVPFVIMTEKLHKGTFQRMIFVNPVDFAKASKFPTKKDSLHKSIYEIPILGTFLYYCQTTKSSIVKQFRRNCVSPHASDSIAHIRCYHEAAHLKGSAGKYLFASQRFGFLACNVADHHTDITTPICVILGKHMEYKSDISDWEIFLNPDTEVAILADCKGLPQLETPDAFVDVCETYLETGSIS